MKTGDADAGSNLTVLKDSGADFDDGTVVTGMLLYNKTEKERCTITQIADEELTCAGGFADGTGWSTNDDYEIVGDGTKDLVVRLGAGYCAGGTATGSIDCSAEGGVREQSPISQPLNVDLGPTLRTSSGSIPPASCSCSTSRRPSSTSAFRSSST